MLIIAHVERVCAHSSCSSIAEVVSLSAPMIDLTSRFVFDLLVGLDVSNKRLSFNAIMFFFIPSMAMLCKEQLQDHMSRRLLLFALG